jgi:hypothetical protein
MVLSLDEWVSQNNPSADAEYAKGFWDLVEFARLLEDKFKPTSVFVAGTYVVRTPPPEEELVVPIVGLKFEKATIVLEQDFARWPDEWRVGVKLEKLYRGPLLGLFDPSKRVGGNREAVEELGQLPFAENQRAFTCSVHDEWDVATLVRLMVTDS